MNLGRRGLLAGLLFAPAIIRTPGLLMPVRVARRMRNHLLTPQIIADEMRKIMMQNIFDIGRIISDGGAIKTSIDDRGDIVTAFIPLQEFDA